MHSSERNSAGVFVNYILKPKELKNSDGSYLQFRAIYYQADNKEKELFTGMFVGLSSLYFIEGEDMSFNLAKQIGAVHLDSKNNAIIFPRNLMEIEIHKESDSLSLRRVP